SLDLRRDGVGVGLGARGRLLRRRYVLTKLEEILLRRDTGGFLDLGAAGERQDDAEEEREALPRDLTRAQRGLTRKCARRFLAQHESVFSLQTGRAPPQLMMVMRLAWTPCETR